MKTLNLMVVLAMLTIGSSGQPPESAAIDSIFSEWNKPNSPGCAIGVVRDGELIFARGYGMANLEYDIPNSPTSVFRIGSTSKQFTAASIILLAEEGRLSLDDTLDKFFPSFPDYAKKITVVHLLNHTSGIRDYITLSYLAGFSSDIYYEDDDVMKLLMSQKNTNFSPGDDFLYSNSGYWILGQIVKKVYGKSLRVFAQRQIFEPLGMTDTHFHDDHNEIVKRRASGYMPNGRDGYRISMTTLDMIGDGGIFTTVEDMKKWDDAFYDSKTLSKNFWELMTRQGRLNNGDVLEYASGLSIGKYKGFKTVRHGGAFVGFRADLIRFPEKNLSVMIFTNRGDANPTEMGYRVADIFLKDEYEVDEKKSESTITTPRNASINLTSDELKIITGYYWNSERSYSRKIYIKNDTLRYYRYENNESDLAPISKNKFKMVGENANVMLRFDKDEEGGKTMSIIVNEGAPVTLVAYEPVDYSKEELIRFTGTYYSEELNTTYSLKMKDSEIVLYINGKETSPLNSIKESFLASEHHGTFHFKEGRSGNISEFRLIAGRVRDLKFVKK